ncbi:MAG: hypothetical protein ACH349_07585, partial [Candidatus Rhabdochlamydia sp.]
MNLSRYFLSAAALALFFINSGSLCSQSNPASSLQISSTQTITVTASQYADFLNAVAKTDPHNLYEIAMGAYPNAATIVRCGTPGHYRYSVVSGQEDHTMAYVDTESVMRFCNWMENGQPIGEQGLETTEEGSYNMSDVTNGTEVEGCSFNRILTNSNASYYIADAEKNSDLSLKSNT